jgi:hypothetical protein
MVAIRLSAMVGKDRRLVVDLPEDTPIGPVELVITPAVEPSNLERDQLRGLLQAAGLLLNTATYDWDVDELINVADDDWDEPVELPPGSPSSEELIDEDRGPR